ncbi:unnamed protein product [Gadus morhua 'NCC']
MVRIQELLLTLQPGAGESGADGPLQARISLGPTHLSGTPPAPLHSWTPSEGQTNGITAELIAGLDSSPTLRPSPHAAHWDPPQGSHWDSPQGVHQGSSPQWGGSCSPQSGVPQGLANCL